MPETCKTRDVVFTSYLGYDLSQVNDAHFGCNLSNSTILSAYPSAPTASKGTYIFADSSSSTKILTAGGSNDKASISLDICSSSTAPYTVLTATKYGTTVKEISAYDGSNTSKLTPTQLIFGPVDYKSLIDSHTVQIANLQAVDVTELAKLSDLDAVDVALKARLDSVEAINATQTDQISALSAVDVTELAKLSDLDAVDTVLKARLTVIENKQPIVNSIPIYHVQSVFADSTGRATYIPASVSAVTPYSGFYYKNESNQKVNWYIQPDVGLTVGDLKGLMLNFYNISATTGLGCPFVACYTKIDSVTPNAASWYKSRKTFCVEYTSSTTINSSYALLANLKTLTYDPLAYGHTKITASTIPGNDKGPFSDSEQILFFSVGTASNSAAGLFEFIASKFTILTAKSTQEFAFQQI
jgi:hypothetical protein